MNQVRTFILRDEDGAVTVDWVVLTAAIVGMAVGVISIMSSGPVNIGNAISGTLADNIEVVTE